MASAPRATCPLCRRRVEVFEHRGRDLFVHHGVDRVAGYSPTTYATACDGSGWLVEAEDYSAEPTTVPRPRQVPRHGTVARYQHATDPCGRICCRSAAAEAKARTHPHRGAA